MRSLALLALAALAAAAKDARTFAVLHFHGDQPLTVGRSDPIVNPGGPSTHVHVVQGGNGFSNSATGESLLASTCSTANVKGDNSAYWMPSLYFHDAHNGSFEPVPFFYMNVYYFFEPTNDDIKAFPVGLQMVSGDPKKATPPATGANQLDSAAGPVQPAQFTCPRSSYDPASYPADSDGTTAGLQDPNNKGAGAGFPFANCDGYASPLRADLHFPSCYDPSKDLTDYKNNMQFPADAGDGKQDCPDGWLHVPHIFFEVYWNTPLFQDRWTPNSGAQPFVLSNGDAAGYSLHGDFLSGWDTDVLQTIIDGCDAGSSGMDKCPGVTAVLEGDCSIANPSPEKIDGSLEALPGSNPLFGWTYGTGSTGGSTQSKSATTTAASAKSESTTSKSVLSTSASTSLYAQASVSVVLGVASVSPLSTAPTGTVEAATDSTSSLTATTAATSSLRATTVATFSRSLRPSGLHWTNSSTVATASATISASSYIFPSETPAGQNAQNVQSQGGQSQGGQDTQGQDTQSEGSQGPDDGCQPTTTTVLTGTITIYETNTRTNTIIVTATASDPVTGTTTTIHTTSTTTTSVTSSSTLPYLRPSAGTVSAAATNLPYKRWHNHLHGHQYHHRRN